MRRIQLASRRPANPCVAVLCQKVPPFQCSALKYYVFKGCPVYGVQNARTYNSDKRFSKLRLDVILLKRCTGFFFNRALSAIFCEHDLSFSEIFLKCEDTKYSVSSLSITTIGNFCMTAFCGIVHRPIVYGMHISRVDSVHRLLWRRLQHNRACRSRGGARLGPA